MMGSRGADALRGGLAAALLTVAAGLTVTAGALVPADALRAAEPPPAGAPSAVTAATVAAMLPWKALEGDGVRLHYLPARLAETQARRLLRERSEALGRLCTFFSLVPAKSVDVFLAPRASGAGGTYVFAETWAVLATWDGVGCVEDLSPGRSMARLFVEHLAGRARLPHPFVLEGLSRVAEGRHDEAHALLVGRASADGSSGLMTITGGDLEAATELARMKAASFFAYLDQALGPKHLAGLPLGTSSAGWSEPVLAQRFNRAVTSLTRRSLRDLLDGWNRALSQVPAENMLVKRWGPDAHALLAVRGEQLDSLQPYRDEPRLQFVALTKGGQRYLLTTGAPGGGLEVERRWRTEQARMKPWRLRVSSRERPERLGERELAGLRAFYERRTATAARGDRAALEAELQGVPLRSGEASERARRLVADLESVDVVGIEPVYRVRSLLDWGPGGARTEVLSYFALTTGEPKLLFEEWRPEKPRASAPASASARAPRGPARTPHAAGWDAAPDATEAAVASDLPPLPGAP